MLSYLPLILLLVVASKADNKKPNIVIILTDDQDLTLDGMTPMKNVKKFISDEGITFTNSYVASPVCCPSRASILTGMYVHNHQTYNNSIEGGCNGVAWRERHEKNTFASVLKDEGYNTFYAGKYSNRYGSPAAGGTEHVPPGWTEWHGLVGNSVYYDYTLSNNGVATHSTDLYLTDVIRDLSVSYIENQTESRPFLMVLAPPAPHEPFTPAPRHKNHYENVTALKTPHFNVSVIDKHWFMSLPPTPLPSSLAGVMDDMYRLRWETLLAVDEMVADVVGTLDRLSMLDNTYLIYTSDNGYHIGQFSQVCDKRQPYESDVRVPLVIKGPGIEKNVSSDVPVLNIDLAPTIIDLAGAKPPETMDGRPIDLVNTNLVERYMLIEYSGEGIPSSVDEECPWSTESFEFAFCRPDRACKCEDSRNNTYACVRHLADNIDIKYCKFLDSEGFIEMYDLGSDQYELHNVAEQTLPSIRHWYDIILKHMVSCQGARHCDHPLQMRYRQTVSSIL